MHGHATIILKRCGIVSFVLAASNLIAGIYVQFQASGFGGTLFDVLITIGSLAAVFAFVFGVIFVVSVTVTFGILAVGRYVYTSFYKHPF